ncbi:MAG: DUF368 domain-containing protein [Lachnospiraceae bacterium]|nr:DUF368 domain-containing protein [Lachnospiraceae bacterium]
MIIDILKGMVMGIANVIPGVSGGTMAVSMGIYDRLIHDVTHLLKEFKKSLLSLLPIGIGMLLGIVGLSRVIGWMYDRVPVQTNFLFIGLIVGGLPLILKEIKGVKPKFSHIISFGILFAIVIVLAVLTGVTGADADLSFGFVNLIKLVLIGIVASATMVIPGVSGSMMLMLLGYYEPVIKCINDTVDALKAMDMAGLAKGCGVLIPFGIGVVIGIIVIAKIIEMLFRKFASVVYYAITGLITASPIAIIIIMMKQDNFPGWSVSAVLTGIVALAAGIVISVLLGGGSERSNKKE